MLRMKKRKELLDKHPFNIWQGTTNQYWYTYLPDDQTNRKKLVKKLNKDDLEEAIINYWEDHELNPMIEDVFNEWNDRRLELDKISEATHFRNQCTYKRFFDEFGKRKICSLTIFDFTDFLEESIPNNNLTAKGFANLKSVVKGILKFSRKRRYIDFTAEDVFAELDVSEKCFAKKIKEDYQEVYDEYETEKMISYLIENKDPKNLAILLMFVSGLRVGELVALRHGDFHDNVVDVRRTESAVPSKPGSKQKKDYIVKNYPKTGAGVRSVVLPAEYSWLANLLGHGDPDEFVFVENGRRMTTNCVRKRLERVCKWNGIYKKSPHKIRKTYGTILLDNHIDNKLIMGQMGHTDITCTERHYHRNRRNIEEKTRILSDIPDFKIS